MTVHRHRVRMPKPLSKGEEAFAFCLRARPEIPEPVREFRFTEDRDFRFDFAWPAQMLAVELDGGIWTRGRHTRGTGFARDLEKLNTAAMLGWRVLRFTTRQAETCEAIAWVSEFFESWNRAEHAIAAAGEVR